MAKGPYGLEKIINIGKKKKKKGERDETMTTLIYHCYGVHLTQAF